MSNDVTEIVTSFLERVRTTRALGAGTPETSYYEAVKSLMDAIGNTLSPHVLLPLAARKHRCRES